MDKRQYVRDIKKEEENRKGETRKSESVGGKERYDKGKEWER
jgi:hypothetical protein